MDTDRSDVDKLKYRGSAYCQCFVNHFCTVLDRYTNTISHGKKDKDPANGLVNGLGWVIGAGVGATAGKLMSVVGLVIASGTAVRVGGSIGSFGMNYLHNKFLYSKKAKTVVRFVNEGTSHEMEYFDAAQQRRLLVHVLVEAALHILEMFEYQFMKIAEADILRSLDKLAYDAACRAVSYIVEHSCEGQTFSANVLVQGILMGISKKSKFAKVTASLLGSEGHTVTTDTGDKWNTAKLFSNVAVNAINCVYVKDSLDKSMGARLPADFTDFEPCETDTQLQLWLRRHGFEKHDWTMEKVYIKVASDKLLTEIGEHAIQRFEAIDLELRLDNIDHGLNELKIGISETNAIVSSTVPSRKISFKPIPEPHAVFTGRDEFIDSAVKYLSSTPSQADAVHGQIQFPCLVIHALGGYGKTQTAKKIASICKKRGKFQHFIWIDSEDDISIGKCFFAVIKQVGLASSDQPFDPANIGSLMHTFYDLLVGQSNERFLIIFDNVEDFDHILEYLPLNYATSNISVLMTSQRQCQIRESYGNVRNQPLELILPDEAFTLVEKVLGQSSVDSEEEKKLLVEQSGRIPLVLHVMTSTIKFQRKYKANYRIEQYLEEITHEPIQYNDQSNILDLSYKKSLREIVRFAITRLSAIAEPIEQIAVKIFDRVAYCSPTGNISPYFIQTYFRDVLKEADNVDLKLPLKIDGYQVILMAIELLHEFSLMYHSNVAVSNSVAFSIHRLIQASRRLDLKDSGDEKIVLKKLMSNSPNVSQGKMESSKNTLPIWFHVADYADLTNEFYPLKGTLIEFSRYGAIDVAKKIIKIFGLPRSVRNIIADYKYDYYIHCPNPMEIAIEDGNQEMVDLYTQTIVQCKKNDPEQFAAWSNEIHKMIVVIIQCSRLQMLEQFVSALNVDMSERSTELITAAIESDKLDVIKWLINEKSCFPQKCHLQQCIKKAEVTTFILAALEKLEPNIDLTDIIQTNSGKNLLICLLHCSGPDASYDTVQTLLERGFDPEIGDNNGWNALHYAAWENNVTAIDLILSKYSIPGAGQVKWRPAIIESRNNNGWTPLTCAARSGACEATMALLEEYSAYIDADDSSGYTPLIHAIEMFRLPVVEILLGHGAKTSTKATSERNVYALHYAAMFLSNNDSSVSGQIVKAILASKDCDVNATDLNGNNVLHILTRHYYAYKCEPNHYVLELLLSANPLLVSVRNSDGLMPIQLAKNMVAEVPENHWHAEGLKILISRLEEFFKDRENNPYMYAQPKVFFNNKNIFILRGCFCAL